MSELEALRARLAALDPGAILDVVLLTGTAALGVVGFVWFVWRVCQLRFRSPAEFTAGDRWALGGGFALLLSVPLLQASPGLAPLLGLLWGGASCIIGCVVLWRKVAERERSRQQH